MLYSLVMTVVLTSSPLHMQSYIIDYDLTEEDCKRYEMMNNNNNNDNDITLQCVQQGQH